MIIILGPTSSGKTKLGLSLCEKFNGEIVSADSRQIYKYMDIGTGKIPVSMMEMGTIGIDSRLRGNDSGLRRNDNKATIVTCVDGGVGMDSSVVSLLQNDDLYWTVNGINIHMYDVVKPDEYYSVFDYRRDAREVIHSVQTNGKLPIIVGGTGLYINALLGELDENLHPPVEGLREKLNKKSIEELIPLVPAEWHEKLNESDKKNPRRLIRLIEKLKQENSTMSLETPQRDDIDKHLLIYLNASRENLYARVDKWVDEIWINLCDETKILIEKGYENTDPMKGLVYKSAVSFIKGETSKDIAIQRIKFDLHSYIRRQQTWFKKYPSAIQFDISKASFDIAVTKLVESYIDARN